MSVEVNTPIIQYKGSKTKKQIRNLKKGKGKLVNDVDKEMISVMAQSVEENVIHVPIVLHYEVEKEGPSFDSPFSFS